MLWTVLIFLLLCAIGGGLWLHYRQEQAWRHELAQMEREIGEDESADTPSAHLPTLQKTGSWLPKFGAAKSTYSNTVARLRLLSAQRQQKSMPLQSGKPDYVDDTSAFSEAEDARLYEYEQEMADEQPFAKPVPAGGDARQAEAVAYRSRGVRVKIPEIVPFVETEVPEYVVRKVEGAALSEITLEEATRSLSEAAMQEMAIPKRPAKLEPVAVADLPEPALKIQTSPRPMQGLEVIDFNDPALRRTRERVLASVQDIHIPKAQAPHIESTQTALKSIEREVIPVADIPSRWDEINVTDIRNNLARRSAARHRLAAAVAPVRDFQPQIIQDEEILANLSQTSSPVVRRDRPIRRIDTSMRESVLPDDVRVEQSTAKVQPKKSLFPPKVSRFQQEPFIAKPPAPTATVVEPPAVPVVEPAPIDIAKPPVFAEPPVLTLPEVEVSAHVSHQPARSISDFLVSESAPYEEEASATLQTASSMADEETDTPIAVFEHDIERNRPSENTVVVERWTEAETGTPEDNVSDSDDEAYFETVAEDAEIAAHLPGVDLLLPPQFDPSATQTEEALLENSITIEEKLAEFKVKVKVMDAYSGPVITRYEIEPDVGVRGNAVLNLEKDLARSLGVASIRVVETIPGKTCMGLELPNPRRQMIRLSEIFNSPAFTESKSKLTLALGQDITGQPVVTDLAKAPHLLVAGTTGSGKSVGVNAMILSMLFKASPEDVRMIMIDPKMLELSIYEGIPHLLAPVVTDMKLAANALNWCVNEMEKRYRLMSHTGVRNLAGFNQKVAEAAARGEKMVNPFTLTPDNPEYLEKLPFIVVVVDEFADLMMTAGKKIEELIARLAQKARAAGIHLILATQRPSVDVITGLIKANIPTRIAFQVSSKIDSRTILDQMGAENLLGQGDMLFLPPGTGYPQRVHGAFASDEEVHQVVEYLKQFGEPNYVEEIFNSGSSDDLPGISRGNDNDADPMYDEAVALVIKSKKASISGVQRALRIGYNRAARLIDQMENDGIVSAPESNGNRTILVQSSDHLD